jgi:hypothetical protein
MMGPNNPYGPSGPPPPGITSHSMPPGVGMRQSPRYPSPWSANPGVSPSHGHLPPPPGGPPKSRSSMTNTQLQQLSAQMKAYRLLARNVPPPEALMSIVHGRKPTQAMLASFNKGQAGTWSGGSGSGSPHSSSAAPSPGGGAGGQSAPSPNPSPGPGVSSGSGGNINLYPPSPNLSQSQGASPKTPQQQQQQGPSLLRSTSATSLNSVSAAPNVTISSSGELPLPVRQAISAAQTGSTAVTTAAGQPVTTSVAKPAVSSSSSTSLPSSSKAPVKLVKLGPPGKPMGVDPIVIAKEREHR